MLRGLTIRDILLIERLDLDFQAGLNVLTGETGAGKSILLDSLGVVLGWRGRGDVVREGAEQGEVTAEFTLPQDHPVFAVLDQAGLRSDDDLVLRRTSNRDGRKQGYVNDRRCSTEILRQISDHLVELHGQHDDRGLLNARGHRALLDEFGALAATVATCRTAWRDWSDARAELEMRQAYLAKQAENRDYLEHAVAEIDMLAPKPGEDAKLDTDRRLMQSASRIREGIAKAGEALSLQGAEGLISDAQRWLRDAEAKAEGRLEVALAALDRAVEEMANAQSGIEDCLTALDFNPSDLERTEERLFAIRALARKHGVGPDDLAAFGDKLRADLGDLTGGEKDLTALKSRVATAEAQFRLAAETLSQSRRAAAARLDKAMAGELKPLKMEAAVFTTQMSAAEPGPDGVDQVQFTVATNPGAPAGPLGRIASGGELSRFLLALKVCLSARADGLTMIFDEIDRGVGGATADAVGRRLAALAEGGQVLVVTHSPQVAALGAHHWLVEKSVTAGTTSTRVSPISGEVRTQEIARMLAGDKITDQAKEAAKVLLAG